MLSLFCQLTPGQSAETWKVFLNLGVVGIIAFCVLAFIAAIIWTLWVLFRRFLLKYFPQLLEEAVLTLQTVRSSQEGIVVSQQVQADNTSKLIALHEKAVDTTNLTATNSAAAHAAVLRNEEFLSLSLDAFEDFVRLNADPSLKIDWNRHITAMRATLQRTRSKS